jgi:hypothetical protein
MKLRLIDYDPANPPEPGDVYYAPWYANGDDPFQASGIAEQHKGKTPIVVVLPNRRHFCVHQRAYKAPAEYDESISHSEWEAKGWYGDGWTVIGEPPDLTITPSISADSSTGIWHGYITNGEVTPA